jgi:hypothetical protein
MLVMYIKYAEAKFNNKCPRGITNYKKTGYEKKKYSFRSGEKSFS